MLFNRECRRISFRRLGHASLRTTSIYGDVVGPDERAFAERGWTGEPLPCSAVREIPISF
jgi:hypothetical protein